MTKRSECRVSRRDAAGRKEERPRVSKWGRAASLPVIHRNLPEHASTTTQWTAAAPDTPRGHGLPSAAACARFFRRRPQLARRDSWFFFGARMTVSGAEADGSLLCGRSSPSLCLFFFLFSRLNRRAPTFSVRKAKRSAEEEAGKKPRRCVRTAVMRACSYEQLLSRRAERRRRSRTR